MAFAPSRRSVRARTTRPSSGDVAAVVFQRFVYLDKASQSWSPHGCVGLELCGAVFSVIPHPLGQMWQMLVFSWAWDQMSTGRSYIRPTTSLPLGSFQLGFLGLLINEMRFKMCQTESNTPWRLNRYSNIWFQCYLYTHTLMFKDMGSIHFLFVCFKRNEYL